MPTDQPVIGDGDAWMSVQARHQRLTLGPDGTGEPGAGASSLQWARLERVWRHQKTGLVVKSAAKRLVSDYHRQRISVAPVHRVRLACRRYLVVMTHQRTKRMADSVQITGATQSSTSSGSLLLHLHAHLPFVRHPEEPVFLEESWLFEAITDTYLPLLMRLQRLHDDGVAGTISMTMSPPLCEMLADPMLQQRYENYLGKFMSTD